MQKPTTIIMYMQTTGGCPYMVVVFVHYTCKRFSPTTFTEASFFYYKLNKIYRTVKVGSGFHESERGLFLADNHITAG